MEQTKIINLPDAENSENKVMTGNQSLLFHAANFGNKMRVIELLDRGVDPNFKNRDGDYPLYKAMSNTLGNIADKDKQNFKEISHLLINSMTTESIKDFNSHPLRLADDNETYDLLIEKGADLDVSRALTFAGSYEQVKHLLDKGADVNYKTSEENSHIIDAATNGDIKLLKIYIDYGADISSQETALVEGHKYAEIAKLILIDLKLKPSKETREFLNEYGSDEVTEILKKVEMNEKMQIKHPPRQSTKKMTLGMKI